jgi:hypothetical protein
MFQKTCSSSRWLGGIGTIVGCSGMVVASFSGVVGVAASGAMKSNALGDMAGMGTSPSNPGWVNAISGVGQPLLIVSLLLVIIGLLPRGPLATILGVAGSLVFYVSMFVHYSQLLAIAASIVLIGAYVGNPSARASAAASVLHSHSFE